MKVVMIMFSLGILFFISAKSEKVQFYFNDCLEDLSLANYHNYTGITTVPPPTSVKITETAIFEFQYAKIAAFGSLLDGNVNYDKEGQSHDLPYTWHYWFNVNKTGYIAWDVESVVNYTVGTHICSDIDVTSNNGTLPHVIGAYAWWIANSTYDQCKSMTKTIQNCEYTVPHPWMI
eukprot:225893_1